MVAYMSEVDGNDNLPKGARLHSIVEWAQVRGMTQAYIVRETGIDKSTVSRWFNGQTPTLRYLKQLAALFGTDVQGLFERPEDVVRKFQTVHDSMHRIAPDQSHNLVTTRKDYRANGRDQTFFRGTDLKIPVYGTVVAGLDGEFVMSGDAINSVSVPPRLASVADAYAVVVSGDTMSPRYFDGETVYVDPHKRVRKGDFVVAQILGEAEEQITIYVKRFVRHNSAELVLSQYNPEKELIFPHDSVKSVDYIALAGDAN